MNAPPAFAPPCSGSPDLFFSEVPADVEEAKAICFGCPIRSGCLVEASTADDIWGVWGGELFTGTNEVPYGMKCCTECSDTKPVEDFWGDNRFSDGLAQRCKTCARKFESDRRRRRTTAQRERINAAARARRRARKAVAA